MFNTNTNEREYVGVNYPTLSFHVPQRILQGNPGSSTITLHNRRGDWSEVQTNFMTDISTKLGNDRGYYVNTITNSSYDSLNHMAYRTGCETTSKAIRFCQLSEDDVIQDDPRLNGLKYCYIQPYFYILDAALWGKSLGCGMTMWDRIFISAFNSKGNHIVWVKNWKFYKNHESELCVAPQPGEYYDVTPANFSNPLREPIGPNTIFQVPAKSTRKFYTADTFTVPKGITSVRMTTNGNAARYFDAQYFDGSIKVREFTYTETNVNNETRTTDFTIKANQILNIPTNVSASNLNTGDNANAVLYGGFVAYNPMANMLFLWGTLDYGNIDANQNIGLTHIVGVRSNGSIVSYGQPKDHPLGEERRNTAAEYFDPYMPVGATVIDPNRMMVFFHARTNGGRRCKFVIYEFSNNYTTVTLKRIADYNGNVWDKTLAFPDMARHHCLLYSGPRFGFCGQVHTPAYNSDHKIDIYMQRKLIGSQPEERDNDVEAILNTFGAKTDLNVYKMFNSSSDGLVCYIPAIPIFLGGYYSMMQETIEITLQPNLNKDRPHSSDGYYDANYVYLQRDPDDRTKITASTMPIRIITEGETVFQKILVAAIQTDEEKPIDTRFYTINTGYNDWKFHGAGDTTPIGTIIMWYSETNPASGVWLDCNGQDCSRYPRLVAVLGTDHVPNMQGLFPRSIGSQEVEGTVHDGGNLGTKQGDAIRNITGKTGGAGVTPSAPQADGAFYSYGTGLGVDDHDYDNHQIAFDASRVVPTANENRPASISMRFLIKAE